MLWWEREGDTRISLTSPVRPPRPLTLTGTMFKFLYNSQHKSQHISSRLCFTLDRGDCAGINIYDSRCAAKLNPIQTEIARIFNLHVPCRVFTPYRNSVRRHPRDVGDEQHNRVQR